MWKFYHFVIFWRSQNRLILHVLPYRWVGFRVWGLDRWYSCCACGRRRVVFSRCRTWWHHCWIGHLFWGGWRATLRSSTRRSCRWRPHLGMRSWGSRWRGGWVPSGCSFPAWCAKLVSNWWCDSSTVAWGRALIYWAQPLASLFQRFQLLNSGLLHIGRYRWGIWS